MLQLWHGIRKAFDNLTWLFGALSIALLLKQGFAFGFVAPMARALDYYDKLLHLLFGWAEPYLIGLLRFMGLNLQLYPHWKYVLVLMWLYFGVVTRVIWPTFKSRREHRLLLVLTAWGALVSLATSVAAGAIAMKDARSNGLMAVFPLIGFVLYQLAWAAFLASVGRQETWWNRYRAAASLYIGSSTIVILVLALVLAILADRLPLLKAVPNPGLTLLFVLVLVLAFRWLWTGVEGAVRWHMARGGSWWRTFRSMDWWKSWRVMSNTRIGLSMLKAIGGALLYVILGAGLE